MQSPGRVLPFAFTLCVVGAFAIAARRPGVWTMLAFATIGFVLRLMKHPMALLVPELGTLPDKNLRRGPVLSEGSVAPSQTRLISAALAAVTLFLLVPLLRIFWNRRTR